MLHIGKIDQVFGESLGAQAKQFCLLLVKTICYAFGFIGFRRCRVFRAPERVFDVESMDMTKESVSMCAGCGLLRGPVNQNTPQSSRLLRLFIKRMMHILSFHVQLMPRALYRCIISVSSLSTLLCNYMCIYRFTLFFSICIYLSFCLPCRFFVAIVLIIQALINQSI